jgi:hypothetical protein
VESAPVVVAEPAATESTGGTGGAWVAEAAGDMAWDSRGVDSHLAAVEVVDIAHLDSLGEATGSADPLGRKSCSCNRRKGVVRL